MIWVKYVLIFVLQFSYNYLRVYEIRHSYDGKTSHLILNTILMNATALFTTYISISEMLKGDLKVCFLYILGAAFGKWVSTTKYFKNGNKKD
jgi:hypothetical protein